MHYYTVSTQRCITALSALRDALLHRQHREMHYYIVSTENRTPGGRGHRIKLTSIHRNANRSFYHEDNQKNRVRVPPPSTKSFEVGSCTELQASLKLTQPKPASMLQEPSCLRPHNTGVIGLSDHAGHSNFYR